MCNLGTIFRGMSIRKDLNTVLKNRERELERGGGYLMEKCVNGLVY